MQMEDWNNDFTFKFLELYKSEPILWDPMYPGHKDKKRLYEAWLILSRELGRPISELKRKKASLMATFRGHSRKIRKSMQAGASADEVHKPIWFAFDFMENFLARVYKSSSLHTDQTSVTEVKKENEVTTGLYLITEPTSSSSTPIEEDSKSTILLRSNSPDIQQPEDLTEEAYNQLNNVLIKKPHEEEEDECDLFGKMLAKKLRKLPEDERQLYMYEIDGLFIERLKYVSHTKQINQLQSNRTLRYSSNINL